MATSCLEKSMVVHNRLLQTLSDIFNYHPSNRDYMAGRESKVAKPDTSESIRLAKLKAEREWFGAIAALEKMLVPIAKSTSSDRENYLGLILCSPTPVIADWDLVLRFPTGVFTTEAFDKIALIPHQLPAAEQEQTETIVSPIAELPLLPKDPLAKEPFCLILTAKFALAMVLGRDSDSIPTFHFSFEPELIEKIWLTLRSRLILADTQQLDRLDRLIEQFTPPQPDYRLVSDFSRQLLKHLPDLTALAIEKTARINTIHTRQSQPKNLSLQNLDSEQLSLRAKANDLLEMELLQALTHEIRTPLTTIRTLTRLLLKRKEFSQDAIKRLETIDRECTEQIDRMELIFQAAELETMTHQRLQLVPVALEKTFERIVPCWEKQAQRRNIKLDVYLPKKLPQVISDPAMLDRVLTGLMENITKSLPCEGKIRVQVTTAGDRLKLQFSSQCSYPANPLKSLGQLLMFQPETGSLSLNLQVTKNLFNALGGKLIVRQRSSQGEVLTIFLPLGNPQAYQIRE
jgi:signal transduction histidine kinase